MIRVFAYGVNGYDPEKPNGNASRWIDTDTGLSYWTDLEGGLHARAYNENEAAWVESLEKPGRIEQARKTSVEDLAGGIARLQVAQDAARDDVATAQALKAQAEALQGTIDTRKLAVAASTPAATLAYVTNMRDQVVSILGWLSDLAGYAAADAGYRAAVDQNAIYTDGALIELARLAADQIEDTP